MKVVKISQNKQAIVDDEDFARVINWRWSHHHTGYVVRGKPQISLHRFIMGAKKGQYVDHVNGDRLDNRKENLRFCTRKQNQWNTRSYDGIHWRGDREAWIVRMRVDGRMKYIGYFKEKKDAEEARRQASLKYHGRFSIYAQAS